MILPVILQSKAATYFNTSITALSDATLLQYMTEFIKSNYPNLRRNEELYARLTTLDYLEDVSLYEWWFGTPIGPKSCSRDIGDLRSALNAGRGDEWGTDLEESIIAYQTQFLGSVPITGYACTETIRRLRL